ncbi:hypothetical protein [Lonepinella koalarum]|nr:hypothetical protein [Lonepinella koalarum]MDH2927892.1 hypothetical protein [Lonepinella koalarum]TFJ90316.1 hypothetical protein E0709_02955 [Lonepinella koalarum]
MKKLSLLLSLFIALPSVANLGDITKKQLNDYVVKGNNITACFFPDLWHASSLDERNNILESWRNDTEKNGLFKYYQSLYYPLLADSFGEENATTIFYGDDVVEYYLDLKNINDTERNKITVHGDKDCQLLEKELERLFSTYPITPYTQAD